MVSYSEKLLTKSAEQTREVPDAVYGERTPNIGEQIQADMERAAERQKYLHGVSRYGQAIIMIRRQGLADTQFTIPRSLPRREATY